ncbi:MAG: hypothetical protein H7A48_04415 [Akkermansiaceae bacterium]|nr:hypothetical protein [Akkermansiaceae bacterium]MCP5548250.1 hypothetical protein [Akkermansiaceae bacterium]
MLRPRTLLPILLGSALGAGGILQGIHRTSQGGGASGEDLRAANEEIAMLRRENESLRSLAQGGGEVSVPRELITRVEKELGVTFLSSPVVHRIAAEELRDRIAAAVESRFGPSGADDRQESYRLMGVLGPDEELVSQLSAARSVGTRGWFDEASGEAWVTDRYRESEIPDQAALLRLLARILLHQHFPPPPTYPGDDPARAREALHQGGAAGVEARYYSDNARAFGFVPLEENKEAARLFSTLSPFIQGLVMFPITEGKGTADSYYVQGTKELLGLFHDPPQTTRAIVFPAEDHASPPALDLPAFPEEPYLSESAGLLGLRLWLETLGDAGVASELSRAWKNDRYALVPDGEASVALVWDIMLESADDATGLEKAALSWVAASTGAKELPAAGEVRASEGKRQFAVHRIAPDRIRIVNAATREVAEFVR